MNIDLVLALLSLALHWWLGWRASQKLREYNAKWDGEAEISAMFGTLFFGVFFWVATTLFIRFQNHGSLFGKGE